MLVRLIYSFCHTHCIVVNATKRFCNRLCNNKIFNISIILLTIVIISIAI